MKSNPFRYEQFVEKEVKPNISLIFIECSTNENIKGIR